MKTGTGSAISCAVAWSKSQFLAVPVPVFISPRLKEKTMRRARTSSLIALIVLHSLLGLGGCGGSPQQESAEPLAVYCFHGDTTCENCDRIEQWTHEAIEETFPEQLADGRIHWEVINFQQPGNEHYAEDYDIITSCIVLDPTPSEPGDDWTNLQQQVWEHATAEDREGMKRLIVDEVKSRLGQ